jgi:hypothetical protein
MQIEERSVEGTVVPNAKGKITLRDRNYLLRLTKGMTDPPSITERLSVFDSDGDGVKSFSAAKA